MNKTSAITLVLPFFLTCVGCVGPIQGGYTKESLGRMKKESTVQRAVVRKPLPSVVTKVVILEPEINLVSGKDLGAMKVGGVARAFSGLLEDRLKPYFQKVYVVRPDDPRLKTRSGSKDTLILKTKFVELDRGSPLLRNMVSCGVGSTKVQVNGRAWIHGEKEDVFEWVDRTGSWVTGTSQKLLFSDINTLAKNISLFIIENSSLIKK